MTNTIHKGLLAFVAIAALSSFAFSHDGDPHKEAKASMFTGTETTAAKTVLAFHKALETGDVETARSLLADNVLIFEGQGVERSAKEYASHHMLSDMKYSQAMKIDLIEHHVLQYDGIATSFSRSQMTGMYKGKSIDRTSNETITLINRDSQWKISHIHWSN